MAAVTVTSNQVQNGPVFGDRPGLNVAYSQHVWSGGPASSTSLSVSVCLQMLAIPNGARLVDLAVEVRGATGQTQGGYAVGDASSTARYVATTSLNASRVVTRATTGLGFRYSLTESDFTTFDTIDLTFSGAALTSTLTLCVEMVAYYVMDRANQGEV